MKPALITEDAPVVIELHGIRESDLQGWKHHPVSKVVLRFLTDYAEKLRLASQQELEASDDAMPAKRQGEYKGRISTLIEVASLEIEHLAAFYGDEPIEPKPTTKPERRVNSRKR